MMNEYENLIFLGNKISETYAILEKAKEKYNIFEILDLEKKESILHSKFIFNLINLKGKNPLNKLFLKTFIEIVLKEEYDPDEMYSVNKEYSTSKYGRLDFYIVKVKSNFGYVIEMKIDANDQENQLHRYESFLKEKHGEKYKLFYLTLDGKPATEKSITKDTTYQKISFEKEIHSWINNCLEKSQDLPMMRETLRQYLNSINKITNEVEEDEKMELKNLLLLGQNLRTAKKISEVIDDVKKEVENKFWIELREKIKQRLKIQDNLNSFNGEEIYYYDNGFYFYKQLPDNNQVLSYGLEEDNGKIYFFAGVEEKIDEEWNVITNNIIEQNLEMENKLYRICEEFHENSGYFFEYTNTVFDFNSDDFYILVEKESLDEKEALMENLTKDFEVKYSVIQELF